MTTERELLDAVCAAPELDEPRLSVVEGDLATKLSDPPRFERGFIAELYLTGTFGELARDFANAIPHCARSQLP